LKQIPGTSCQIFDSLGLSLAAHVHGPLAAAACATAGCHKSRRNRADRATSSRVAPTPTAAAAEATQRPFMIEEFEAFQVLLGMSVLLFIWRNRVRLRRLRASRILTAGFCVLLASWVLSVFEGFFWEESLNLLQHTCSAISGFLLAAWSWKLVARP